MEFKFRAIDNVKPTTTSHSPLSPATSLPDPSLQMDGGFSGLRPLTGEAALQRAVEKEQIRRELLRRMELEEEVRRELAIERELGISMQGPLNIQGRGLVSQCSNPTVMNSVVVAQMGSAQMGSPSWQPTLFLPSTAISPSPEISDKDKVIVLARPDPELFNAKRKAAPMPTSETGPSVLDLKKKQKQEWDCALCGIKATSKSGLNAHLNGKKHKTKEARENREIFQSNKKSEKFGNMKAADTDDTPMVDKSINEPKSDEQLVETVVDNDVSAT
ncbi:uncharacterized protein LOC131630466 [Vicia villosa]|uniref:uncharacterized protein LOC131630466 n=1 Tax=Vicia villosa TaxID=3911 RepID=UPI00273BD3AD|nr:uncharacterized protein LOC131630466 [Vicia villosa]